MSKLVLLELDGDLEFQGFRATLEIRDQREVSENAGHSGGLPVKKKGYLPPNSQLAQKLQDHWQQKYGSLGDPCRIKSKKIIYKGSINQRLNECKKSAQQLQEYFTDWLRSDSFREIDSRLREALNPDEEIRFLINTDNQHLKKLPWHLWDFFSNYSQAEPALSCLELDVRIKPKVGQGKIRILAILGHSQDIDISQDRQLLESLPQAETVFLVEPKHEEINDQLWEQSWDIIFFAGHSETEGETGRIYLNSTDSLTLDELWYALRKAVDKGLQLAIFNSCSGLGLAEKLDDLHIPQMIVMRELVPDRVAHVFLRYFLTAFASGKSFYLAVREARERLQGLESKFPCASWLPVIYQNLGQTMPNWDEFIQPKSAPIKQSKTGKISRKFQTPVGIAASVLLFGMGAYFLLLPQLSNRFNQIGVNYRNQHQLNRALFFYQLALKLQPNNHAAASNLGEVAESLQDFPSAAQQYAAAKSGGKIAGCNNEAHLILVDKHPNLKGQYQKAEEMLRFCLSQAEGKEVQYALSKNLGWALLKQDKYDEAEIFLLEAIDLIGDRAPAYCLLAEVLEEENKREAALVQWGNCLDFGDGFNPEEQQWITIARNRLQEHW
jgi:tetratricopeptide (TPR) repeat protein